MITPPLEPGKRYPVFFQHYGGPARPAGDARLGQARCSNIWSTRAISVFQIDNRGSHNRGKAFEDQIYRAMGSGRGRRTSWPARNWLK